ncbi:CGNR zinc finger domain-containing protein [Actinoplanes siamensis]|uniref:Zinc finger CGNR domain-containing protein n=1 Tax=Actinoplanes siamensis TaxID=1223317 RepID=A0A919MXC1_9ACTN|nr:CGNR zinc finger domain-containing protein [Actinoplanes siamensis]GIF03402.1 hypothetical protein Asi03nite_09400 [Actinoplanes siamensis]
MRQPGDRTPAPAHLAVVQDLANTVDIEAGSDQLSTPAQLVAFCARHGITAGEVTDRDVLDCRELREALRDACHAHTGEPMPAASLESLRKFLRRGPLLVQVGEDGGARLAPVPLDRGVEALTASVAAAIATALLDGSWSRLKACAAHSCRWVYYDRSPGGRSRWCTMSICGSRTKMRAYRGRGR